MTTQKTKKVGCTFDSGRITPCKNLVAAIGPITVWSDNSGNPRRNLAIAKIGDFKKGGIVFNFCPFCGTKIFDEKTENVFNEHL